MSRVRKDSQAFGYRVIQQDTARVQVHVYSDEALSTKPLLYIFQISPQRLRERFVAANGFSDLSENNLC